MNGNGACPYLRNELNRSAERYHRGQQSMRGAAQISSGISGDVRHPEKGVLGPGLEISRKRRGAIEGDDVVQERPLSDDGHHKSKPGCCFQGSVGNGIQFQLAG